MISSIWPIYENPTYLSRRPEEYNKARTKIYVETQTRLNAEGEELFYVIIGHKAYKLPDALDDGSLAWIGGFSSGLTEIIFLGESWVNKDQKINKRIEFFDANGFNKAAEAYRRYAFPESSTSELRKNL